LVFGYGGADRAAIEESLALVREALEEAAVGGSG
jgi:hypothetical protein